MSLCRNATASLIPDGTALMFAGTLGNSGRLLVAPMVANGTYPGYVFFGIATVDIPAGADGFVTSFGKIRGINTNAFNEGDILWCNPAVPGGLTNVEPQAPNLKLPVAAVVSKGNNGILMVRSDTGRRLQDLHDVEANGGKVDGDVLAWSTGANRWEPTSRLSSLETNFTNAGGDVLSWNGSSLLTLGGDFAVENNSGDAELTIRSLDVVGSDADAKLNLDAGSGGEAEVNFGRFGTYGAYIQYRHDSSVLIIDSVETVDIYTANSSTLRLDGNGDAELFGSFTMGGQIFNFANCPVYANDGAAATGGLTTGDIYRTATGELRFKL